jgi:hypothetical protein
MDEPENTEATVKADAVLDPGQGEGPDEATDFTSRPRS